MSLFSPRARGYTQLGEPHLDLSSRSLAGTHAQPTSRGPPEPGPARAHFVLHQLILPVCEAWQEDLPRFRSHLLASAAHPCDDNSTEPLCCIQRQLLEPGQSEYCMRSWQLPCASVLRSCCTCNKYDVACEPFQCTAKGTVSPPSAWPSPRRARQGMFRQQPRSQACPCWSSQSPVRAGAPSCR